MKLTVFAVRDLKALAFLQPFYSPSVGSALRAFGDACNESGSPFNKHPEDYQIFEIGSYEDSDALLKSVSPLKLLGSASDFVLVKPVVYAPVCNESPKVVPDGKKPS